MSSDPRVINDQFLRDITSGPRTTRRISVSTQGAVTGLTALLAGDLPGAGAALGPRGFTVAEATDPVTGRPCLLARSGSPGTRLGGLFLVDRATTPSLCVGVPHPDDDQACVDLALRLWRLVPGSLLALATVPPGGASGRTDPTRDTTSLFHAAWAQVAGPLRMTQIQIGGFSGRPPRGPAGWQAWGRTGDVIVSVGPAGLTLPALRIAERVEALGRGTRRDWDGATGQKPTAWRNAQALLAARHHWAWVALSVGPMVRSTPERRQSVADAAARADPTRYHPVDLGTARGSMVIVDTSVGDHFLLRLESDVLLRLSGTPGVGTQVLLHVEAAHEPRTVRLLTGSEPSGRETITILPNRAWYAVLRRADAGRWRLVQSNGDARAGRRGVPSTTTSGWSACEARAG
jgi:hypothetical protein